MIPDDCLERGGWRTTKTGCPGLRLLRVIPSKTAAFSLHHFTDPSAILHGFRDSLVGAGRLVIIEFEPGGLLGTVTQMGTDRDRLIAEVTAGGFEFVRVDEWPGWPLRRRVSEAHRVRTRSARRVRPPAREEERMKYTLSSDIPRPRATVVELFNNPHNWPKWQDTLVRSEALEGAPGNRGSRTKLIHKFRRREVEMNRDDRVGTSPDEMTCVYEAPGAWNRVVCRFAEVGPNETRSFSEGASRALREFMKPHQGCVAR